MKNKHEGLLPPLWIIFGAIVLGILWLMYELREIMVLLVVGYCIAYIMEPLLQKLERRKVGRGVGVVLLVSALALVLLGLGLTAGPVLGREFSKLSENLPHYVRDVQALINEQVMPFLPKEEPLDGVEGSVAGNLQTITSLANPSTVVAGLSSALLSGYSITLFLVNLALLPFIVFYLAVDFPNLHRQLLALFPRDLRPAVRRMALDIDHYVAAFVRGQIMVCTILFVLYAVGLGALGLDLWLLLAVISGFGNLIPYVGTLVGITLSSIMAAVTYGSLTYVWWVLGLFAVIQFLEGTFITPNIVGNKVGLSPLVIILALFAGGQLFGLLGVFLAVPLAAIIRVLGSELRGWLVRKYQENATVA